MHISFCIYKSEQGKLLWRWKRLDTFNKLNVKKTSKANLEGAITSMRTFRFLPPLQSHIASFLRDGTIFDWVKNPRHFVNRVFPRCEPFSCFLLWLLIGYRHPSSWLAQWFLWFWFYKTQSKSALLDAFADNFRWFLNISLRILFVIRRISKRTLREHGSVFQ